jgi:hypothetical protein
MVKQTTIRLTDDIDKFLDSWAIDNVTRTDLINDLLRKAIDDIQKGEESRTEVRIKEPTTENPQKGTEDLNVESVCMALDIVSQQVGCAQKNQILPIYRLPCFHEYLDDNSIIQVKPERVTLKCTHECKFRHARSSDNQSRLIGLFLTAHWVGASVAKLPQILVNTH